MDSVLIPEDILKSLGEVKLLGTSKPWELVESEIGLMLQALETRRTGAANTSKHRYIFVGCSASHGRWICNDRGRLPALG